MRISAKYYFFLNDAIHCKNILILFELIKNIRFFLVFLGVGYR